jgi:hypothetical protein
LYNSTDRGVPPYRVVASNIAISKRGLPR